MPKTDQTLHWDGDALAVPEATPALGVALNRRRLLALAGATVAGAALAAPALPISSAGGSATAITTLPLTGLEVEQFLPLVGETFSARVLSGESADTWAQFVLADVTIPEAVAGEQRPSILRSQPFSLLFTLGAGTPGASSLVRFEHEALGKVELFVHQVLTTGDTPAYEAVFN